MHWAHKAINSLSSQGSLCRYTDMLCRTKGLIFGEKNLLECFSSFIFSFFSFAYHSVNMWGKTMSYFAAVCEDTDQEDAFTSPSTSELFSITNVQSIQHDCLPPSSVLCPCLPGKKQKQSAQLVNSAFSSVPHGDTKHRWWLLSKSPSVFHWQENASFSFLISMGFRSQLWGGGCLCARWFFPT